ncbi:MAG: penicillin-binding transpeptidase domain-containing protein [Myxococcaceae bacterium]
MADTKVVREIPRRANPPLAKAAPGAPLFHKEKNQYVAEVAGEWEALTLDVTLQEKLQALLERHDAPYAVAVAIEPSTGRVLAMAEHSAVSPAVRGLSVRALFPAASVFKIVTAAALLEAGVSPGDEACYFGGKRRISERHLKDSPRDRRCASLADALGHSTNGVFAKLTHRHLAAEDLKRWAAAFHFNRTIDFPLPLDESLAAVPEDALGLAETGAGFGDVWLTPLHGALIAAVAANGGLWRAPVVLQRDVLVDAPAERVLSEAQAAQLTEMLEVTVTQGTARRVFRERGHRVAGAVGKTGSLADHQPFRDYSWFVGFAPKDAPKVAVATVVVNGPRWKIRAPYLAREAMRFSLERLSQSTREQFAQRVLSQERKQFPGN